MKDDRVHTEVPAVETQSHTESAPRILGFDVGDRRIGLAISDPLGYTAQPLFTLHRTNRRADFKWLARVLRKHGVREAVVGNPLYMSGDQSPQAAKAQAFAQELRTEFGIAVHLWDERLTTTQAHRHLDEAGHAAMGRKGIIDQVAAVLILQAFLDSREHGRRLADNGKTQLDATKDT